ncbi:SAM-dependent methyltransferase [Thermodesulfobacteriota bacterium]
MKPQPSSITASPPYAVLLASTSITVLAYEILLMRLLSISLWHHFAYMVISMALLGFGASGSILFLLFDQIKRNLNGWLILLSSVASVSFSFTFSLSQRIGLDPLQLIWQPVQWVYMLVTYLLMTIPFIFAGGIIGIILTGAAARVDRMYAIDLLGAGCGALVIVPVLYTAQPWKLLPILGYLMLSGSAWCCLKLRRPMIGFTALLISCILLTTSYFWVRPVPKIHETKGLPMTLRFPDARIEATEKGPLGVIHVVGSSLIRHVPGLSLNFGLHSEDRNARIPPQKAIFVDGDGLSPITSFDGELDTLKYLDYTSMALPYHIRDPEKLLVVGAGGGTDILLGLQHHTKEIIALEANRQIANLLLKPFAGFSGQLYARPEVKLELREARQFLHSTNERYDLIQLSLIDSFVNSAGGLNSATVSYLYTVEAFVEYLTHLTDSGMFAITRWLKLPPRDSLRTLSTALRALRTMNISGHPEEHIIFIRSWKTYTILISKSPFNRDEILKAKYFCDSRSFDLGYYAGMKVEEANQYDIQDIPYYYNGAKALCGAEADIFLKNYPFDVSAIMDDRPFFDHFFRWKKALVLLLHLKREWLPIVEMGYLFILATFTQTIVAGALLILMPLFILRWARRRSGRSRPSSRLSDIFGTLLYFSCIGLGFMFLEMAFIPRYTLLLSHPVYATSVVLATILVFAGFGSLSVERFKSISPRFLWIPVIVISSWVLFHTMIGDILFDRVQGFPLWGRSVIAISLLMMPSFFLGWLFPSGLQVIAGRSPDLVPWAWGINGCASVIGSVSGKCLAVSIGFKFLMFTACIVYFIAVLIFYTTYGSSDCGISHGEVTT